MVGLADRMARDERKVDDGMKELLRMDARKCVMDRVVKAMEKVEA